MCRLNDKAGYEIANSLKKHQNISRLILKENSLKDKSGLALSELVKINKTIKLIDLSRNPISYRYIIEVNKGIKYN